MPESIKQMLHKMMQCQQVLLGSLELGHYATATAAARELGDQSDALIDAIEAHRRGQLD